MFQRCRMYERNIGIDGPFKNAQRWIAVGRLDGFYREQCAIEMTSPRRMVSVNGFTGPLLIGSSAQNNGVRAVNFLWLMAVISSPLVTPASAAGLLLMTPATTDGSADSILSCLRDFRSYHVSADNTA